MKKPEFIDLQPTYKSTTSFDVVNEEPEIVREMLGKQTFPKIGSICSAGEMLLLVLAGRATEKIIAIDHSYNSMAVAYAKALFIQKLGPKKAFDTIQNTPYAEYVKLFKELEAELPVPLQYTTRHKGGIYGSTDAGTVLTSYNASKYRGEWHYSGYHGLYRGWKNFDKLTFVHGDLYDTAQYGPFDLFYVSNAQEHSGRNGTPNLKTLVELVRIGGLLLIAGNNGVLPKPPEPNFKIAQKFTGYRTAWTYFLLERTV